MEAQVKEKKGVNVPKDTKGMVEVRMKNPKRTGTITLRDYTDRAGKLRKLVDENGDARVIKYTNAVKFLDLKEKNDRLEYVHLKDHPIYVLGSSPKIVLVNKIDEAEKNIDKKELAIDAMLVARELRGEKLADFSRILGVNTSNVIDSVIKSQVYDFAETKPKEFMSAWNDPNRPFKQVAYKGKNAKVFSIRNKVWYYRDVLMGANIDEVIVWLNDNEDLLPSIRKEINSVK